MVDAAGLSPPGAVAQLLQQHVMHFEISLSARPVSCCPQGLLSLACHPGQFGAGFQMQSEPRFKPPSQRSFSSHRTQPCLGTDFSP